MLARSPKLFAGSYVLHRLILPRHPPCALSSFNSPLCARHKTPAVAWRPANRHIVYPIPIRVVKELQTSKGLSQSRTLKIRKKISREPSILPGCPPSEDDNVGLLKEVIQPQVPLRLPCYDFTPVADLAVDAAYPKIRLTASGATNSRGVTGGVYKARERIHRGMLIRDY